MTDDPTRTTTDPENGPQAATIATLVKRRLHLILIWGIWYQEIGGDNPVVAAQQGAIDDITRQIRLLKQEHGAPPPAVEVARSPQQGDPRAAC